MQELLKNPKKAGATTQLCVRSYDVVTTGKFSIIRRKFSNTIFFKKYLSPLVDCLLQTTGISLIIGASLK